MLETLSHSVRMQLLLKLMNQNELAGHHIQIDMSDGYRVCFVVREYIVGVSGQWLSRASVRIKEMAPPDDQNSSKRALFPQKHGCNYNISKLYSPGPNWNIRWTS